jgi:putative copper export protein
MALPHQLVLFVHVHAALFWIGGLLFMAPGRELPERGGSTRSAARDPRRRIAVLLARRGAGAFPFLVHRAMRLARGG